MGVLRNASDKSRMAEGFDLRDQLHIALVGIIGEFPRLTRSEGVLMSDEFRMTLEAKGAALVVCQGYEGGVHVPFAAEIDSAPVVGRIFRNASCVCH